MIVVRIILTVIFLFRILVANENNSPILQLVAYALSSLGLNHGPLTLGSLYCRMLNRANAITGILYGAVIIIL
ncbi:MAG: hypothetical protein HUJ51_00135 [Eggerthellaceae bacterium]|nr:hypothetical protein [Eggerthellaceae bacterium]